MFPHRLAVHGDSVYWSDVYFKTLHRANKYTGSSRETLFANRDAPGGTVFDLQIHDSNQSTCELRAWKTCCQGKVANK